MDNPSQSEEELAPPGQEAAGNLPLPSLPRRLVQVVVAPVQLFRALRDEPRAWAAIVVGAVLVAGSTLLIPPEVFADFLRNQMLESGAEISEEFIDGLTQGGQLRRIVGAVASIAGWTIIVSIQAGLYALLFLFGLGYEGRYKQYFAVSAHAMLIAAMANILLVPIRIRTGDITFTPSLEGFVPFLDEGLVFRWLSLLDLLSLWIFALSGLGAGVMDGKGKEAASAAIAVGAAALVFLLIASFTG